MFSKGVGTRRNFLSEVRYTDKENLRIDFLEVGDVAGDYLEKKQIY